MAQSEIQVFIDESATGVESVGILICGASIVEIEGELVPGCTMTPQLARELADALVRKAEEIES